MVLIPVLDLRNGYVVRAIAGKRDDYRAISSALCASAAPGDVVAAFLSLYPFELFYIADLDAIEGRGDHRATVAKLMDRYPSIELWLDGGFARAADFAAWPSAPTLRPVVGSESQGNEVNFEVLMGELATRRPVLSLDFKADRFLGPSALLAGCDGWPDEVIVMELDRVGADRGPAIERLTALKRGAGDRRFYMAGGVRDPSDLNRLEDAGCAGALIASALHDRRLSSADLARAMRRGP